MASNQEVRHYNNKNSDYIKPDEFFVPRAQKECFQMADE
jgi:hypothetical protein